MATEVPEIRVGIVQGDPVGYDSQGRLCAFPGVGVLVNELRARLPGARLLRTIAPACTPMMNYPLDFPPEALVTLPPLGSVVRSQWHFFSTRRVVREFAATCDVMFLRVPFQIPLALAGLGTPKLIHVVANVYDIIAASSNYHGLARTLALRYAAHSNATFRRMAHEPMTRVASNGQEMWDLLECREGRVVVSSCIHERDMQPREQLELSDPPRLLFVGYLRPKRASAIYWMHSRWCGANGP